MELSEDKELVKTIIRLRRKFEEGIHQEKKIKYLNHLMSLPITLEVLKATSIGKVVNNLRKDNGIIGDIAKEIILKWKDVAANEKLAKPENSLEISTDSKLKNSHSVIYNALPNYNSGTIASKETVFANRNNISVSHASNLEKYSSNKIIPSKEASFAKQHNISVSHASNSSKYYSKNIIPSKEASFAEYTASISGKTKNILANKEKRNENMSDISLSASIISANKPDGQLTELHCSKEKVCCDNKVNDEQMIHKHKMSFEDMLMMPVVHDVKKKKKKSSRERFSMPTLPDIELPSYTPEPIYRPSTPVLQPNIDVTKQKKNSAPELSVITSRKTRSAIFSGKKVSNGIVTSLYQQCMRVLIENVDSLYETGGVPYLVLEPVLSKCTPQQLERLEYYNPHFIDDSDVLWKKHCFHEFKGLKVEKNDEDEEWRDVYKRLSIEREERLKRLSSKINQSQATKVPERSVKLAYVSGTPKASVQTMRKQKRFGTGNDDAEKRKDLRDRMDKSQRESAESVVPFVKVPRRDRCAVRPPSSLSTTNQFNGGPSGKKKVNDLGSTGPSFFKPQGVKKKDKKPMMSAALKLLKKQKGRMTSSIMRR